MDNKTEKYIQAKERVRKIKGFYTHLTVYILVNTFITLTVFYNSGLDKEINFGTFSTWIFWGIGVFFHGLNIFGKHLIFSKDWEKRKIQELMDNDIDNEIEF